MGKFSVRRTAAIVGAVATMAVTGAWAAGDWSDARAKAEEFKTRQQELRKLEPEEARGIVLAICAADEEARKDVGRDAAERVARKVNDKLSELERARNDAIKALESVIDDNNLKSAQDEAKRLKEDVLARWESIERMSRSLRGANHPVIAFTLTEGQSAHKSRQERCDASEVVLSSGKADCLMASGETCQVIEIKPNNSQAIRRGRDQVRKYQDELNAELRRPNSEIMRKLIGQKSDFAKCTKFEVRIDCYTLCPDINQDNEFRSAYPDWKQDCS